MFSTYILGQKVDLLGNVTLSRFRFLLFLNSVLTILLFLNSFWSRFGPYSRPFKECDNVTLPVLDQKVDLLRNVTMSRLMFWANGLIYSGNERENNLGLRGGKGGKT